MEKSKISREEHYEMRVGLVLNDHGFENMDFTLNEYINPGIGGSEYMFLMLGKSLKMYCENIDVTFFHFKDNVLPDKCDSVIVSEINDILSECKNAGIDALIHGTNYEADWYAEAEKRNISLIVWAHCFFQYNELQIVKKCSAVKKIVCVGKQEYDTYVDTEFIDKITYIYNMYKNCNQIFYDVKNKKPVVTYIGSITKEKGFHVLAKEWKKILKKVPDARLVVMGSGRLYSRDKKMGKYNIAEEEYENTFMSYLTDKQGNIIPSVEFKGIVREKEELLKQTKVGVVNPTAQSETFCISAVDMEAMGIPVVTKQKYGLCDTVKHKKTGLTFKSERNLSKYVIRLLKNNSLNALYGKNALEFATHEFETEKLTMQWKSVLDRLEEKEPYLKPADYYFNNFKYIRIINRKIRMILGYKNTVSIAELVGIVKLKASEFKGEKVE
jgi:glycosyltransferase involved in cell wall biosynthesis